MSAAIAETGVLWFPHHFLGDIPCLGSDGVFFQQSHGDCGGAALKMILEHFRISTEYAQLWQRLQDGPEGTTMLSIKKTAEFEGLICEGWRLSLQDLPQVPLPAILLLQRSHYGVMTSVDLPKGVKILDPVRGRLLVPARKLASIWNGETLLFCSPGIPSNKQSRWFARWNHLPRRIHPPRRDALRGNGYRRMA